MYNIVNEFCELQDKISLPPRAIFSILRIVIITMKL